MRMKVLEPMQLAL
jgi:histone deacetylase 11